MTGEKNGLQFMEICIDNSFKCCEAVRLLSTVGYFPATTMNHPHLFSTPLLRQLVLADKAGELIARRDVGGFVLVMREGALEQVLSTQRGGFRCFKHLDAVASYLSGVGIVRFLVELADPNA